ETSAARDTVKALSVKASSIEAPVATLSGGNQQKVVLGKWLALQPRVLIFDEPTQGVDVGAKAEIHRLIRRLADEGAAFVMISSEIEEIVAESDRVAVMHEGRITGILDRSSSTPESIMQLAIARPHLMTRKELGVFLLLVALCAIVAIASPQFLSVTNVQNVARLVGTYGIFSIGVGFVIITGGIDLSIGSICALLGVLLSMMLVEWRWPATVALAAVSALGAGLGAAHGLLVARLRLQPFIVTLCGLLLYRGAARDIANDSTKGFGTGQGFEWVRTLASGSIGGVPMPFVLMCVVA